MTFGKNAVRRWGASKELGELFQRKEQKKRGCRMRARKHSSEGRDGKQSGQAESNFTGRKVTVWPGFLAQRCARQGCGRDERRKPTEDRGAGQQKKSADA